MPSSVEKKTVCSENGKLAVSGSSPAITEYFATDTAPTEVCPGHKPVEPEEPKEEVDPSDSVPVEPVTPGDNTGGGTGGDPGGNPGGGTGGGTGGDPGGTVPQ